MLCDVCRHGLEGMFDHRLTPRVSVADQSTITTPSGMPQQEIESYVWGHHRTLESFQESIRLGCLLCYEHYKIVGAAAPDIEHDQSQYFSTFTVTVQGEFIQVHVKCLGVELSGRLVPVGSVEHDSGVTFDLDENTSGPRAWQCAEQWVRDCVNSHDECNISGDPNFTPTRLLRINGEREPPTWSLMLRDECSPGLPFNTLSYVWGKGPLSEKLRLLQSTIDDMRHEQSIEMLPKTFQDAIRVCLRLKVYHLWIDSLCIVQDSEEDWEKESQSMHLVYRNSYLTISTVWGVDDSCGLFCPRDTALVAPTVVQLRSTTHDVPKLYRHRGELGHTWNRQWVKGASILRAWCVQERLLASRVLHFHSTQLFWECRHHSACEVNPYDCLNSGRNLSVSSLRPARNHTWKQLLGAPTPPAPADDYERMLFNWYIALHIYTDASLTFPSDKLVALAGISNDLKRRLHDLRPEIPHRYIAGLWEEDLRTGLCWSTRFGNTRPTVYRAPSWSWASIDGASGHLNCLRDQELTWFVQCSVPSEHFDEHNMAKPIHYHLQISGPWMLVHVQGVQVGPRNARLSHVLDPVTCETYNLANPIGPNADNGLPLEHILRFDVEDYQPKEVYCVLMQGHKFHGSQWSTFGILLSKVDGGKTFKRVGNLIVYFLCKTDMLNFISHLRSVDITVI
jgi:hypothetical protein